jgi:hypothetical protein
MASFLGSDGQNFGYGPAQSLFSAPAFFDVCDEGHRVSRGGKTKIFWGEINEPKKRGSGLALSHWSQIGKQANLGFVLKKFLKKKEEL